jgi:hypothetical protein
VCVRSLSETAPPEELYPGAYRGHRYPYESGRRPLHLFCQLQWLLEADAARTERASAFRKQLSRGCIMEVNMVWIWQHKLHAAKGIPWSWILTQFVGEVVGTDRRPVDQ